MAAEITEEEAAVLADVLSRMQAPASKAKARSNRITAQLASDNTPVIGGGPVLPETPVESTDDNGQKVTTTPGSNGGTLPGDEGYDPNAGGSIKVEPGDPDAVHIEQPIVLPGDPSYGTSDKPAEEPAKTPAKPAAKGKTTKKAPPTSTKSTSSTPRRVATGGGAANTSMQKLLDAHSKQLEQLQAENAALQKQLADSEKKWTPEEVKAAIDSGKQALDGLLPDNLEGKSKSDDVIGDNIAPRFQPLHNTFDLADTLTNPFTRTVGSALEELGVNAGGFDQELDPMTHLARWIKAEPFGGNRRKAEAAEAARIAKMKETPSSNSGVMDAYRYQTNTDNGTLKARGGSTIENYRSQGTTDRAAFGGAPAAQNQGVLDSYAGQQGARGEGATRPTPYNGRGASTVGDYADTRRNVRNQPNPATGASTLDGYTPTARRPGGGSTIGDYRQQTREGASMSDILQRFNQLRPNQPMGDAARRSMGR